MTLLETYFELPHPLQASYSLLGEDFVAQAGELEVTIRFPRSQMSANWPLLVPPAFAKVFADDGLSEALTRLTWGAEFGHRSDDPASGTASVTAVGLATACGEGDEQDTTNQLTNAMEGWWLNVCDWIEVLTRQVHRSPRQPLLFGPHHPVWAEIGENVARLYRHRPTDDAVPATNSGPDAPLLLTGELFETVLALAATGPPQLEWLLIRDARVAHWSGATRRAVLDAGTATELAITKLLRSRLRTHTDAEFEALLKANPMLGKRKALLEKHGGSVPPDTQRKLINRRNLAAHQGNNPSKKDSSEALLIAVEIVETAYPLTPHRQPTDRS